MTIVSERNITPIKPVNGLVAFGNCIINNSFYIGSIGIYKRRDGSGYRITYPTKTVGSREINVYHPITKEAHDTIERALIEKCEEVFERGNDQDGRYSQNRASDS